DLHRGVLSVAVHVREQLSGRQGLLQLSRVLERLQASAKGANDSKKADLFCGTAVRFYRLDLSDWSAQATSLRGVTDHGQRSDFVSVSAAHDRNSTRHLPPQRS